MTQHQKIDGAPNLSRRSFIVGTAATGLVLGYAAFPDMRESLAATPASFEPTAWYAIGNDGKIVVTVGKSRNGSAHFEHHGATHRRGTGSVLEGHQPGARLQRSDVQRPCAGNPIDRRQLQYADEFRCHVPRRRCRPHHAHQVASEMLAVPENELRASESRVHRAKSKRSLSYAEIVKGGKANKVWTPAELKAIALKTAGAAHQDRAVAAAARHSVEDEWHLQVRHRRLRSGHALRQAGNSASAIQVRRCDRVDDSAAKKFRASSRRSIVRTTKTGSTTGWVVAVGSTTKAPKKAAAALKVDWDGGPNANVSNQSMIDKSRRLQKEGTRGTALRLRRRAIPPPRCKRQPRLLRPNISPPSISKHRWSR